MNRLLPNHPIYAASAGITMKVPQWNVFGGDVNATGDYDSTELMEAAKIGHTWMVQWLLGQNVDVNAKNKEGRTALLDAAWNGHAEVVEVLIKAGADADAKDNDGWTVLMYAAIKGDPKVVKLLLDALNDVNAMVNFEIYNDLTAFQIAKLKGHHEIAKIIEQAGGK